MNLRKLIENHLYAERLDRKQFGEQIGWGENTLTRFLNGKEVSSRNLALVLLWLLKEEGA